MEIEQLEIYDFLRSCYPLSKLDEADLKELALTIEISYSPRDKVVLQPGEQNHWLYLIRSGAVMRQDHTDGLLAQFSSKDFFGHKAIERNGLIKNKISCVEDSLFYLIPETEYHRLMEQSEAFLNYFIPQKNQRLKTALNELGVSQENILANSKVSDLLHNKPLTIDAQSSIKEVAKLMRDKKQTAALVVENGDENNIKGIVTDRIFCTKVVAGEFDSSNPIAEIMTPKPVSISSQNTGLEAMLLMTRLNIRHLPVIDNRELQGILTATDLIHQQSHNPFYLVNAIHKAEKKAKLIELSQQLPTALCQLVDAGLPAHDIAYSISSIGRSIMQRAIRLSIKKLGEPPIPFAYLVAGSLARNDQTGHSDQDNGLLLSDQYDERQHAEYFEQLSKNVSDILHQCGYVYCPGEVMASNPKWRQPLSVWRKYFRNWITKPQPEALLYASIFFDLRCVYGEQSLLETLHNDIDEMIQANRLFLGFMAANAQQHRPPLGLFRRFVLEKHGTEQKYLEIKKRGILPCTDLARVFALDASSQAINTRERLLAAQQQQVITATAAEDITDCFDFLSLVRLQHQAKRIKQNKEADNHVVPDELSSLERRHLKDAFELLRTYQEVMIRKYNQSHR